MTRPWRGAFSGSVSAIKLEPGAFIQPGVEVAKLADTSTWLVKTTGLAEVNVFKIQSGMGALITMDDLPGATFKG